MSALDRGQFYTPRPLHRAWGAHVPIQQKAPAAGEQWKYTTPGGYYTRLLSMQVPYVASGVVGNRNLGVILDDGQGNQYYQAWMNTTFVAGSVTAVSVAPMLPAVAPPAGFPQALTFPDILLPPGWVIEGVTNNIQAGDAYGQLNILVEQFEQTPDHPLADIEDLYRCLVKGEVAASYARGN